MKVGGCGIHFSSRAVVFFFSKLLIFELLGYIMAAKIKERAIDNDNGNYEGKR